MDFAFFGANLLKLKEGGYVPILIGLAVFTIMDTWRWGRAWIGRAYQARMQELPLTVGEIVANTPAVAGGPGSISLVVMASRPITSLDDTVPPVMAQHYANWRRLPKHIIFMSIVQTNSPFVPEEERYATTTFRRDADGTVVAVQARYGYMEQPNVRLALAEMKQGKMIKLPLDPRRWLILIGSERFITPGRNLREKIRIGLFSRMNRLAKPVTDYFGLETDSAVTMEAINV
jgi:KUP system potassium uptake protein